MIGQRTLFIAEFVVLLAVGTPLSISEGNFAYWLMTALAAGLGWMTTVRRDRPLLSAILGRVSIVAAFVFLVVEYFWIASVPVMALSHFMTLVCCCKLLTRRTLRDHTQILVLGLLLLVIAAIVSDHVLFLVVLIIYLTAGLGGLVWYHLLLESGRVQDRNALIARPSVAVPHPSSMPRPMMLAGMTSTIIVAAVMVGVALFVLSPRVGAGVLGHLAGQRASIAVTGFATTLNFRSITPIRQSEQPAMRVSVQYSDGSPFTSSTPLYFRGTVLTQYQGLEGGGTVWQWRRFPAEEPRVQDLEFRPQGGGDEVILPLLDTDARPAGPWLEQTYRLDSGRDQHLFTCYPVSELLLPNPQPLRLWPDAQVLQLLQSSDGPLHYTVRTQPVVTPTVAAALAETRQRQGVKPPMPVAPSPPLPREVEIRELIGRLTTGLGPPTDTEQCQAFASRIANYLQSDAFTYTLNPPALPTNAEPVGAFLLDTRRGHCEYFASAMAVMCQMSGIPARVVNGFRSDEYNAYGGFYVVRRKDAHAWVEVFVPGLDWVTFDPTPAQSGGAAAMSGWVLRVRGLVDYLQFQWSDRVVSFGSDQRRALFQQFEEWLRRPTQDQRTVIGALVAFVRELFGWRLNLTLQERLIYWVFTLLVLTLAGLLSYVLVVISRAAFRRMRDLAAMRAPAVRRLQDADFYDQMRRRLAGLGIHRSPHLTPAEFASDLAVRHPSLAPVRELVDAYYAVVFGGVTLSAEQRERIQLFLASLNQVDRAGLGS